MPKIALATFRGEAPRISARALPNEGASLAVDCRLLSGDLEAWNDILDVGSLVKVGPTNTEYLFGRGININGNSNGFWFNWGQAEVQPGFTNVDVARVPVVNDTTLLTVFTGTAGSPRITDISLAVAGNSSPFGPYPLASDPLGVNPPGTAPTVVNTPGTQSDIPTTTNYNTQMTGWVVGFNGGFGSVTSITSGGFANIPLPAYEFTAQQQNSTWAGINGNFGFALSDSFSVTLLTSSVNGGAVTENQDTFVRVVSDGNGATAVGAKLRFGFTAASAGAITWTDEGAGSAPITIGTITVGSEGLKVVISAKSTGKNASNIQTYTCAVTITDAATNALVASATGLTATWAGDEIQLGCQGGDNPPDTGLGYFGNIIVVVNTPPALFIPVFSNYVYTYANSLGFESSPSPASNTVQVDNGNTNAVTIPPPPGGQDVQKFFLYRAATGSSGTQYLLDPNGAYFDGSFPIATVGGTANAITLTTPDGAPQGNATSYFFTALNTNTGPTTLSLNGAPAASVVNSSGGALGAGAILAGSRYTVEYAAPTDIVAVITSSAGQAVLQLPNTTGVLVGDAVSDTSLAVPAGTTVLSIVPGVSVQLSQNLVATVPVGDTFTFSAANYTLRSGYVYVDISPTSALGSALPTANFDVPNPNLQGIISLPNGIMAGFAGNTLYLSAQNQPQAYPLDFALATDSNIVGIAAIDTTVLILTDSHPYTAYGATPDAFTMTREEFIQGCVSKRSISYLRDYGIIYASTDGIYAYSGQGRIINLTKNLFTIKEWLPLNPSSIIGICHQGLYFFWYTQLDGTKAGYVLDPDPQGFGLSRLSMHAISPALDTSDDGLYLVLDQGVIAGNVTPPNNELVQWDSAPTKRPYTWKSKLFQFAYPHTFMMCKAWAADYANIQLQLFDENGAVYGTFNPFSSAEFTLPSVEVPEFQFELSGTSSAQPILFVENARQLLG